MIFKNRKLLNDVVLDYSNSDKIYALAKEYDKLEQGAAATGFYLRAADMSPGKTFEEKWLQYKSMILSAHIYQRTGDRSNSVLGLYKIAIATMPERPEAYYFASKFYQSKSEWRDSLMFAQIGIACNTAKAPDNDLNYHGKEELKLLYARAKWKTDGRDDSKNLAFDLKYKHKLKKETAEEVDDLIKSIGYPSTLAFTQEDYDRYKFKFDGIENIEKNYSRHFQDMFVLSVLNGKRNGTFVEIGSGHPELFNNTLLLEKDFGWKGISIDNSERMCHIFSRTRSTNVILADGAAVDYGVMFKQNCIEQNIDFLRINAEKASLEVLKRIPFDKHEFATIQFQHNSCWWGNEFKEESRKILSKIGYVLFVPDVAVNESNSYEDWWVHPTLINKNMKASSKINFAWDYMMEKL